MFLCVLKIENITHAYTNCHIFDKNTFQFVVEATWLSDDVQVGGSVYSGM
jgi:hypothetical protein